MLSKLAAHLAEARRTARPRPWVTLAHAQTLDGAVALRRGERTAISGEAALRVTHHLRTLHDAIVVGIQTVLADDPILDARYVAADGPRPVVLDSLLRMPVTARLMERAPWIACTHDAPADRRAALLARGAEIIETPRNEEGRVDLHHLCAALAKRGVRSVMLEGGPRVITSFTAARLLDYAAVTLSPRLSGGMTVVERPIVDHIDHAPRLVELEITNVGTDLLLAGEVTWPS